MKRSWIVLAAYASLMTGIATSANAQESPAITFARAAAALNQRLGTVETGPLVESTDQVANASDIAQIEQAMAAFGTPAFPVDEFATIDRVCDPLNQLSVRHLLDGAPALRRPAGAAAPNSQETAAIAAQLQALQQRNSVRHQDPMVILSTSGIRCVVAHFPLLAQFLATLSPAELTPVRVGGVRQMRLGIAQTLYGAATALRDNATTTANRNRILNLMNEVAVPFASALTPELRREMIAALQGLPVSSDPRTVAASATLLAALSTERCVGLCLVR